MECLTELDLFPNPQLLARLANAPCEDCVRMCSGTDKGDDRCDPYPDADVVLRRAIKRLDIPSLGEPSGLGVSGRRVAVATSSRLRLDSPATGAAEVPGSVSAVVGAAFADGVDDSVSGCRLGENNV
jgi:hypothetical protein